MRNSALSQPSNGGRSAIAVLKFLCVSLLISSSLVRATNRPRSDSNILLPSDSGIENEPEFLDLKVRTCTKVSPLLFYRPVIGILSHPGDGASGRLSNSTTASYIPASYVNFVESAGARVIPLIYNDPPKVIEEKLGLVNGVIFTGGKAGLYYSVAEKIFEKVLRRNDAGDHVPLYGISLGFQIISTMVSQKLNLVNGVLFTGGWAKTGLYYSVAEKIFKKILERNDAGDHFPLHAVCLGFEILSMIISKDRNILESFNSSYMPSTLDFVDNVNIKGTVFQRFPHYLLEKLSTDCIVMQNHRYGISPGRFEQNTELSRFFEILTTSNDEDNKVYVSTVHARDYPVTAFQWHPEKNAFEWGSSVIPHTENAIEVTQHVANHFISEARKSLNRPPAQKVLDSLIYNYIPTFGGKAGKGFDEVYIFT